MKYNQFVYCLSIVYLLFMCIVLLLLTILLYLIHYNIFLLPGFRHFLSMRKSFLKLLMLLTLAMYMEMMICQSE